MNDQTDPAGADVGHSAGVVAAVTVADCHAVAGLQPQHLCMCGIFSAEYEKAALNGVGRNKKLRH